MCMHGFLSSIEPQNDFFLMPTFANVGIKKKSFCGSIDSNKPCIHVDFGKGNNAGEAQAEALIGTRYVTLNNSIQDNSFVKQTLGYRMMEMADLPNSRCNYARVFVNGTLIGQGVGGVNAPGIFVNAEPIMKQYIERNFSGNMNGNLYEIAHKNDFLEERLEFIGVEDLSKFEDKADLKFACEHIKANGLAGADQLIDMEQYLKLYAMEFLLKHWDGYADNTNNTYLYNDVDAVATPGVGDIKFKFIPWGIDQTLQPNRPFKLGRDGLIAQLVRNDDTRRKQLIDQIRAYRETLFSREHQQTVLKPLIDQMQALVTGFGVPNACRRSIPCGSNCGWPNRPDTSSPACPDPPTPSTSSSTTPVTVCMPATPSRFRRAHRPRRTSRCTTSSCSTTTTRGPVGSQRPRHRKVVDQSGFQPQSARQRDVSHTRGAQVPLHMRAEQRRPCRRVHDLARTGTRYRSRQPAGPLRVHRLLQHRQRADERDGEVRR